MVRLLPRQPGGNSREIVTISQNPALICSMIRHLNKETGSDYVQWTELKNKEYKLRQEKDTMKRLLKDINEKWTKEMDENIWWRLKGILGYL